jgi:leucyl-tRNA synthetase
MPKYDFSKVEQRWRKKWREEGVYEPDLKGKKAPRRARGKPFYNLMMFPYPSAEGLHIGSVRTFTGVDIYGRMKRMQGHDVFEPIGLDGFGIHSENYALKIGAHPADQAKVSEKRFYEQLAAIGNGFAWKEKLETYDPDYYKWTQWIFIQLFKKGLAYRKKQPVNWCPSCKTVLADEQVIDGKCERCSSMVGKRDLEQWFFKTTAYAERLLKNLEKLDWSEKVKTAQRNWIGRSEGSVITFALTQANADMTQTDAERKSPRTSASGQRLSASVEVFTTRPDTLFGATYLVLSPEHSLIAKSKGQIANWKEVEKYVEGAKKKSEEERIAEGKEKTGVELKGIKAVNPATKEGIPVWVADYVLGGYGTGAIMAVPAHDERDYAFAKQHNLPIRFVVDPMTGSKQENPKHKEKIVALVENEKGEVLTINWGPALGGRLLIGGTVEAGEDPVAAARREIAEETGYHGAELLAMSDERVHHEYFAHSKKQPFVAHTRLLHFRAKQGARVMQKLEENERGKFTVEWVTKECATREITDSLHQYAFRKFAEGGAYSGEGILANSGEFSGMNSEEAKRKITEFVGGTWKTQFRLRDWLISRQRYWGPPIPMIFCEHCKNSLEISKYQNTEISNLSRGEIENPGWHAVPEEDLPVKLPYVENFRPTGTGISPLASVEKFYKVKCPVCKGEARRETDVSDTFLDSSWYYLGYLIFGNQRLKIKNKNDKQKFKIDGAIVQKWLPVNMYIGGAEHSVLHLLYARFISMALHDIGVLSFSTKGGEEPFTKFRAHGLITKDGAKMSKSKGNVVTPDDYFGKFGADVMRMYLAFMAPLDEGGDFRDAGILGLERFLMRVWRLTSQVQSAKRKVQNEDTKPKSLEILLHKTIKKVTEDIENLHYNTAISALMILLNEIEKSPSFLSSSLFSIFVKLLAPFAPFMTEEIWQQLRGQTQTAPAGETQTDAEKSPRVSASRRRTSAFMSIHLAEWPTYNPELIVEDTFTLVVQVNGKVRDTVGGVAANISEEEARALALSRERVQAFVGGKQPQKVIYIPKRIVNIVV